MHKLLSLFVCIFALLASGGFCQDESAHLLASKHVLNNLLVEEKDLTVQYNIYNVGSSAAYDVRLFDNTFSENDFEVKIGSLSVKWNRIGPGNNVSHVVILKPLKSGYFNFSAAEITYLTSEIETEPQVGYTSSLGEGHFMEYKYYDRKFSAHVLDWLAFAIMTLPSLAIPYMLWHSSKSKYDVPKPKKN